MLEGTDLYSAWAPLIPQNNAAGNMGDFANSTGGGDVEERREVDIVKPPSKQDVVATASPSMTAAGFNEQYEKEQKLIAIINELKRRQANAAANGGSGYVSSGPSYWDKLQSKKKELAKFFQSALIIIFALSVHFLIQHYFSQYLSSTDVSFERELVLRLLYPLGIAFIAWNIMLIYK